LAKALAEVRAREVVKVKRPTRPRIEGLKIRMGCT
jgi:hypothetical protein